MKSLVLTLALLASSFPVIADDINWYRVTANSLLFVDMLQTVEISKNDKFEESNRALGKNPTEAEVYQYFIASTLLINVIGESLPDRYSDIFYISVSAIQINFINQNMNIGVKIRF